MKKSVFTPVLAVSVALSLFSVVAFANEPEIYDLSVENGQLTSDDNKSLQIVIEDYFSLREDAINYPISLQSADEGYNDAVLRADALIQFWADDGVNIVKTESIPFILEATANTRNNNTTLSVYEWTWVDYNYDNSSEPTDRMGFATIHDMEANLSNNGTYEIVKDSYTEEDVIGYVSQDYSDAETEICGDAAFLEPIEGALITPLTTTSSLNNKGFSDHGAAIDYANTWVFKNIASSTGTYQYPDYYNKSQYGYYSADCANFVSQCLKAGGMVNDPSSSSSWNNTSSAQWWFNTSSHNQYEDYTVSAQPWRYGPAFRTYWGSKYTITSATQSTVFPGNPLLTSGNHVAICVGYDSSGYPIVNAHNRDVYHLRMSGYADTVQIASKNLEINTPKTATTISPSTQLQTYSNRTLSSNGVEWWKFTVTSATAGYYTMYSGGSCDTLGYLYRQTSDAGTHSGETMQMYEVTSNDDGSGSSDGNNFRIRWNLSAGTYYVKVRTYKNISGTYSFNFVRG